MSEENTQETCARPAPDEREILEFGSVVTSGREKILTLVISGQIEGHQVLPPPAKATRYEHVLPLLVRAEEDPEVDGVLFLINTVGGDVEAGLAMAELIAGMRKPTVSLVLGGGHDRHPARRGGEAILHRAERHHDRASGADQRADPRRAAEL